MNSAKKILSYPIYNKNFLHCGMDICKCLMTYNLKNSYTDRFKYKKCYDHVEKILSKSNKRVERLFDVKV